MLILGAVILIGWGFRNLLGMAASILKALLYITPFFFFHGYTCSVECIDCKKKEISLHINCRFQWKGISPLALGIIGGVDLDPSMEKILHSIFFSLQNFFLTEFYVS